MAFYVEGMQREFATFNEADRSARRACRLRRDVVEISRDGPHHGAARVGVAHVRLDAFDRVWTDAMEPETVPLFTDEQIARMLS